MLTGDFPPDPARLFQALDVSGRKTIIAAVSGGGDSLALLLLLNDALKQKPRGPALQAVTIDHGLRVESAQEAQTVGRLCAAHGVSHRTLVWEGAKPTTGISEAAREARLQLLAQAAAEAGTDLVLTGHTADDQAETLAMRKKRAGGRGLAGIAGATLYEGRVWFVRPLLKTRRAALREFLRHRNVTWIDDPTNRDLRFERARTRRVLRESDIARLFEEAQHASRIRQHNGEAAAALVSSHADLPAPGLIRIDPVFAKAGATALYTFRILLAVAGGTPHLPAEDRAAGILLRAIQGDARASLSRDIIVHRREYIYLYREPRNLPSATLADGIIWDGRYRVHWRGNRQNLTIAPFGIKHAAAMDVDIAGFDPPADLARSALAAQPAVWSGEECLGPASENADLSVVPLVGPWARLLPCFDLAPARAVSGLLRGEAIPDSPWRAIKKA